MIGFIIVMVCVIIVGAGAAYLNRDGYLTSLEEREYDPEKYDR